MTKLFTKNKKLSSIYGSLTYPTKKCFINHNFTIEFAEAARFPIRNFKTLLAPEIIIQKYCILVKVQRVFKDSRKAAGNIVLSK